MNSGQAMMTILFISMIIILFGGVGFLVYNEFGHYETVNMSIIDKWVDNGGSGLQPMCELKDHRIFKMNGFDYNHIVLGKTYQMKIYKSHIEIINERWRI